MSVHRASGPATATDPASIARFLRAQGGSAGRRLAEAVRVRERDTDAPARVGIDPALGEAPDLEWLVRVRAAAHPAARSLREADRRLHRASAAFVVAGLAAMAVLGAAAGVAALQAGPGHRSVSVVFAIASLLGLQTALLALWIVLSSLRAVPELLTPLAALAHAVGRRLVRAGATRGHRDAAAPAAMRDLVAAGEAAAIQWRAPGVARWSLGALAHAGWSAFNLGALAALLVLLSVRAHGFSCETTILSDRAMRTVVRAAGAVPSLAGLPVPDDEAIERSLRIGRGEAPAPAVGDDAATDPGDASSQPDADRRSFAVLLLGTVAVHGLAPRVLLAGWCLLRRRRALAAWRLDLDRADFARLRPLLVPEASAGTIHEAPGLPAPTPRRAGAAAASTPGTGPPAAVAIELAREVEDAEGVRGGADGTGWPPPLDGLVDLGAADDAEARRRVIERLGTLDPPRRLLAACSLTTTPDRGIARFLERLREAVGDRLVLVLTDGGVLRHRGDAGAVAERTRLWRELAAAVGLIGDRVHEIDLGRLTDASRLVLAAAAAVGKEGGDGGAGTATGEARAGGRPVDVAFARIADDAVGWTAAPDLVRRVTLHRAIAEAFGAEDGRGDDGAVARLRRVIGIDATTADGELPRIDRLRAASGAFVDRLPAALRAQPAWLAAGAATGAAACLAAAAIVSPVALAALPGWSGVGAAIASLVAAARASSDRSGEDAGPAVNAAGAEDGRAEALRSALLLACALHLQGRGEAAIAAGLESALAPATTLDDAWDETAIRRTIAAVRTRLAADGPTGASAGEAPR